jgi:hypothetical protein
MTIFNTNPQTLITSGETNKMNNIISNLSKQILNDINLTPNIILQENYDRVLDIIFNSFKSFINIYKFGITNIFKIYVEIYNQDMIVVAYANFIIDGKKYVYNKSSWINFYFNTLTYSNLCYINMNDSEKNDLRTCVLNGHFYFLDNINCPIDSITTGIGSIIKKIQNSNNTYIELIVGICWTFS